MFTSSAKAREGTVGAPRARAAVGPSQGFASVLPKAAENTPWEASATDWALGLVLPAEYVTGIGEANLAFSAITYGASAVGCFAGWIQ